ncbi:MAG TPA: thioredoxin domain-containing protein [Roseiflexaceae bacterium]|nr:thioredoxin domain-containing protein [Roseiflexaceae bacterium]
MAQSHKATHHPRGRTLQRRRTRRLPVLIIVLASALILGGAFLASRLAQPTPSVAPFAARTINAPTGVTPDGFAYKGKPDAPVTVIEYGDFQCPSCGAFATQQEAAFDQLYVETGKVRFIYHDFPLPQHNNAVIAAAAARAAGEQGKFWQMHDLLFTKQREWSNSTAIQPLLGSYAEAIGLDLQAFDRALQSEKYVAALIAARQQSGQRGVQATPTFEVNGMLVDASQLQAAIEAALQAKSS